MSAGIAVVVAAGIIVAVVLATRHTDRTPRAGGAATSTPGAPDASRAVLPTNWHLVWSDDFSGTTLDTSKWTALNRSTFGDGNRELACLTDRAQNLSIGGGQLVITARREDPPLVCGSDDSRFPGGRAYSSEMLSTQGKAAWHGGLFEVRAQLPIAPGTTQGLWPAFWLRPDTGQAGTGEIDVLEGIGSGPAGYVSAGVHHGCISDESATRRKSAAFAPLSAAGAASGFHVYSAAWTDDRIDFAVDGTVSYSCTVADAPFITSAMAGKFFLRLNLAVGGSYPGPPGTSTRFPAAYRIDWVRVYQP